MLCRLYSYIQSVSSGTFIFNRGWVCRQPGQGYIPLHQHFSIAVRGEGHVKCKNEFFILLMKAAISKLQCSFLQMNYNCNTG